MGDEHNSYRILPGWAWWRCSCGFMGGLEEVKTSKERYALAQRRYLEHVSRVEKVNAALRLSLRRVAAHPSGIHLVPKKPSGE